MLAALVLTQAASPGGLGLGPYGDFGAVGAVFAVMLAGTRIVWKRETQRADKAEAKVEELEELIRATIVPQGLEVVHALGATRDFIVAMKAELDVYRRERPP